MQALDDKAAVDILSASRIGVLSLARDGGAYAIPLFYSYDGDHVWFHCHPGVKDEWIDATDEACLVVSHIESADIWESVQVFGSLEKATLSTDIDAAKSALFQVPFPPADGSMPSGRPVRSDQAVYYLKLTPSHVEGKSSTFAE